MNRPILVLATVGLLAVLGIGAVTVGSRPSTTTQTPAPTAPAAVEASAPTGATVSSYTTGRDRICAAAVAEAEPVKARLDPLYNADATDAQKADAIAALREILALGTAFTAELAAIDVPPELLAEHSANVANYEDIFILIRESLALHDAGKTADALAVDLATNRIAAQINAFELRLGLTPCP